MEIKDEAVGEKMPHDHGMVMRLLDLILYVINIKAYQAYNCCEILIF